ILVEKLRNVYQSFQELAIPIILSGGVGLGVIFIALANGFNTDLFNYLFGSVSAVSKKDFLVISSISIMFIGMIWLFYKERFSLSFDEEYAKASGLHAKRIHMLFIVLTAFVIAASIRIVCVLLVSGLMTLPVAAAMRLAIGFRQMMILAISFGELVVIIVLISGYYLRIPPGGTIVMAAIAILLLAIGWKRMINRLNVRQALRSTLTIKMRWRKVLWINDKRAYVFRNKDIRQPTNARISTIFLNAQTAIERPEM